MANVEISVKTQLIKIAKDLDAINKSFANSQDEMQKTASTADDSVKKTLKSTQNGITGVGVLMRRALSGLTQDFKALTAVGAIQGGLKMGNMFKSSIADSINLADTVRKLSGVFKIANADQAAFVGNLTRGMGEIGLGSQAAANALQGLSQTQVRGSSALLAYSKTSGMLASAGNESGNEATIAKGLAGILQARGIDVNDTKSMSAVAESVNKARDASGTSVSEIVNSMQDLFKNMNDGFKKNMTPASAAQLTAISAAGGPEGISFIKDYLSSNSQTRAGLDATGFRNLFTSNGLDEKKLRGLIGQAKGFGLNGDVISGLQNMSGGSISEEQAKGLKILYDNLSTVDKVTQQMATSTKNLATSYEEQKTSMEALQSSFNKVKSFFAEFIASLTGIVTTALKSLSHSVGGAIGVTTVAGVGTAAALGGGLKYAAGLLGGGASSVVGGAGAIASGIIGPGLALGGGLAAGSALASYADSSMKGSDIDNRLIALFTELLQRSGSIPQTVGPRQTQDVRVYLDDRNKEFKHSPRGSVGPNQGAR